VFLKIGNQILDANRIVHVNSIKPTRSLSRSTGGPITFEGTTPMPCGNSWSRALLANQDPQRLQYTIAEVV